MTPGLARQGLAFGTVAGEYEQGRPGYPAAALRWCLPARPGRVLDLGAGTGKLTAALLAPDLLAPGCQVFAVEPSLPMATRIPAAAGRVAGTAESGPLADGPMQAVLVGQAFHWFDQPAALAQIVRVLRPGGVLALLWNLLDDRVAWVARFAALVGARERTTSWPVSAPWRGVAGLEDPQPRRFGHRQPAQAALLAANAASRSPVLALASAERDRVLAAVTALAPAGEFAIPYQCQVWRAMRVGT